MILALESATSICSVALVGSGKVIAFREINEGFKHSEKLTVYIQEVLAESNKKLSDIDAVAVSSGPGSYTGLRIGVSVAKGLCYALDKPLISIPTLDAMAAGAIEKFKQGEVLYCPMIDARRMEVYAAVYDANLNTIVQPSAIVVDGNLFSGRFEDKTIIYFGDGAEKCQDVLKNNPEFVFQSEVFPSAKWMASIAERKFAVKEFENVALFEPFYLKEFQAGVKKL